jgi:hypothetical protein
MMNERIEALLIESHRQTEGGIYKGHPSVWTEKFAELIIRDCIQAIQNESKDSSDELEYGLRIAEGAILDHFGVEE